MNTDKYKLLLVEDEKDNLELLDRTLRHKYDIIKTTSPIEGLELLSKNPVDIIIADHKMPEMNGVEFLKKSYQINFQCLRLLITAYSDSNILIEAINEGKIYQYIKKPWNPQELMNILDSAVAHYKSEKENNSLIHDLKGLFTGTVNTIIEALDAKDSFTVGKSRRVKFLALKMAKQLNLPIEEYGELELAGLLHDIGMIGIPEEVLHKTDALTTDELKCIQKHVEHGIKILKEIKQLRGVIKIIKYHHERFDGRGYPYGLKGDEIPLGAKIIAIADAYDSMVSKRSYRESLSPNEAMKRIKDQSGQQFDPVVTDAFCAIIEEAAKELKEAQLQLM